jgi:hypothetical protein
VTARALLVALLVSGCTSYSNRLDATPLAPGTGELGLALDVLVVERGRDHIPLPLPEVSYRRGLRPGVDIGGKAHLTGAEISLRQALHEVGRLRMAWAPGLALGFEPITNNTADVVYARAAPRFIAELRPRHPGSPWPTCIATAAPSLTFTGPATLFAGIAGDARFIARPGAALAARWPLRNSRAFWLELTAQPAYAFGDGWLAPSYQGGAAFSF